MNKYDAIIIGTGQAGPPLAGQLTEQGLNVAIIEKDALGGTCVNDGCTPTKAYVASARRAFVTQNSKGHGISFPGNAHTNLKQVKERKDEIVEQSRSGLQKMFEENDKITLYRGRAEFTDKKTVRVNGEELSADKIFINTGARARIPDGFENILYLTNTSILELEEIPEHLTVVGGGPVGLEFAQIFKRFGSEVTVIERADRLLPGEDKDVSEAIDEFLKAEDISILYNCSDVKASMANKRALVEMKYNGKKIEVPASHVLLATGRVPNTDDLGLDAAGIKTDDKGYIQVNDHCETSVQGVYAMGDCNGRGAFTHTSYNDFQIVNSHLFEKGQRKLSDRHQCYAIYIDPPLARVGMNERQAREDGREALMAKMPMSKVARAREKGETQGFLKVLLDKNSEQFLGATFLGIDADEYIHTIIDQMYAGNSYTVMRDAVHIHPTVSELLPTLLENLEPLEETES